jgi:transketolase
MKEEDMSAESIDQLAINTIRTLSIDAVQAANSGHPGTPMGMAPVAYTIWQNHLRFDPKKPIWADRDRFILSAGHASMLLYSLLYLTEVSAVNDAYEILNEPSVSLDAIKHFRQMGSRTPGHPEYHHTTGVETTTGPLGQGVATSVGMGIAAAWFAKTYNKPGHKLFDHRFYVICGDGDMMEGVSSEAASLAGHLKLANLCWIYDSNSISIEGSTELAFTEDTAKRFESYGWHVERLPDANDVAAVDAALDRFKERTDKPTFILVRSHIGYGAPHKQDTKEAHGEPLGVDEVKAAKKFYGWPEDAKFFVPEGVIQHFRDGIGARGARLSAEWDQALEVYRADYPDLAREIDQIQARTLPDGWDKDIPVFPADAKGIASRDSSAKVLNAIASNFPWLMGGSADLAPSTKTRLTFEGAGDFDSAEKVGRNFHFGVREHAMGAALNGMALHKLRPYGSGFLIFSDYMKPPIRLSALMQIPVIYIFTHDSIGVGEDGPTHQPIEQLATLRATPGMITLRPGDANEVAEAWRAIIPHTHQPACLILSRQPLPTLDRSRYASAAGTAKGGYVLADPPDGTKPAVILIGTGSELSLCVEAYESLAKDGIPARVVSLPSWELFELQSPEYRQSVLPDAILARVSVEAGATLGWERYVGLHGAKIGMNSFGASAPIKELLAHFHFSTEKVVEAAKHQIARTQESRP